ncbi:UNVERIFIED_CONTAM: hypothetical protein FKN15_060192 [Acipenser sinensis]
MSTYIVMPDERESQMIARRVYDTYSLPQGTQTVEDREVPFYIVGDAAYPLLCWLMKPYPANNITPEKEAFNYTMGRVRVVIEQSFGRLKGRWCILLKRMEQNLQNTTNIAGACCILHNICEARNVAYDKQWTANVERSELALPQPPISICRQGDGDSQAIRDARLTLF